MLIAPIPRVSRGLFLTVISAGVSLAALHATARANCVTTGSTTTCDTAAPNPYTSRVGAGNTAAGDNQTVTVNTGAGISSGNDTAISLRDNANITVNGTVQNASTNASGGYNTGGNTIEFRNNGTITIGVDGKVLSNGTQVSAEAINVQGSGNTIYNNGLVNAVKGAAIWSQNAGTLTVVNNGTISTGALNNPNRTATVIGGNTNAGIDFTNRGTVYGSLNLGSGADTLRLYTGSIITGNFSGGGGVDAIYLNGQGSDSLAGKMTGFEYLYKQDAGTWELTGSITGLIAADVQGGTLILSGDNSGFTGTTTVQSGATLQGRAQSLPGAVSNSGLVRFDQPDDGTYAGVISGSGGMEKTDTGTLTLTGSNTYTGGTTIAAGTLQIGDGGTTGSILGNVTNNGTLAFNRLDDVTFSGVVSGTGALEQISESTLTLTGENSYTGGTTISSGTLQLGNGGTTGSIVGNIANDGTLVVNRSNGIELAGVISGTGALEQIGTGTTVLTGENSYTAGTTIASGTLQLGNGGTTGSIVGNIANDGTLVVNRSNGIELAGVISGTGSLQQVGTGTTVLAGENSYTGGTTISAGTLQLGDGGTSGSILGNVTNNGTLAFKRSDELTFDGVVSGNGGLRQIGRGTTTLTADSTYTGATTVEAGTLMLLGSITSNTTVEAGATLGGTGTITGNVSNSGTVAPGAARQIGTLTVEGNYIGAGGILQSRVGGTTQAPVADVLRISGAGNTASGVTGITAVDRGGLGAPTVGNGILVVEAANGATTGAGSFVLANRVASGAYEYHLMRGATAGSEQNFYLSTYTEPLPEPPGPGPAPEPTSQPTYRVETSNYTALPAIQRLYTYSLVDTLEQRRGSLGQLATLGADDASALWGRAGGNLGETNGSGADGLDLSYDFGFLQAGVDAISTSDGHGGRVDAGVFLALGQSSADTSTDADGNTGDASLTAYTAGLYGTWLAAEGLYSDVLAQATRFSNVDASSSADQSISTGGWSQSLSLEAGYRVALGEHASLTPQGQIIAENYTLDSTSDDFGNVGFSNGFAARGRLGLELASSLGGVGTQTDLTLRANVWHVFSDEPETTFSSLEGNNPVNFTTDIGTTWLAIDAGVTTAITENASLFANAGYEYGFDDTRQAGTGRLGFTYNW